MPKKMVVRKNKGENMDIFVLFGWIGLNLFVALPSLFLINKSIVHKEYFNLAVLIVILLTAMFLGGYMIMIEIKDTLRQMQNQ